MNKSFIERAIQLELEKITRLLDSEGYLDEAFCLLQSLTSQIHDILEDKSKCPPPDDK